MNHDEHLDNILDEALSEYRDAEPLAGIESRILARVHASESVRKSRGLRWAVVVACAAAIVAAVWFGVGKRTPHTAAPSEAATIKPVEKAPAHTPVPTVVTSASSTVAVRKPANHIVPQSTPAETAVQTKPSVFPSPSPLTAEERAFMAALNQTAGAMPVTSEPDKAITIAEIEIKPLAIAGLSLGEKQ